MRTPPSTIRVILHFYYSPEPYPDESSQFVKSTIERLAGDGLIEVVAPDDFGCSHRLTERGKAWVEMICATPYPNQAWINPITGAICPTK